MMQMRKKLALLVCALMLTAVWESHAQFTAFIPPKFKQTILYAPVSKYPESARSHFTLGAQGIYRLTLNPKTGGVEEVGVMKYAGNSQLDSTIVMDFFKWRFKPGSFKQIDIPVIFDREIRVELKGAVTR